MFLMCIRQVPGSVTDSAEGDIMRKTHILLSESSQWEILLQHEKLNNRDMCKMCRSKEERRANFEGTEVYREDHKDVLSWVILAEEEIIRSERGKATVGRGKSLCRGRKWHWRNYQNVVWGVEQEKLRRLGSRGSAWGDIRSLFSSCEDGLFDWSPRLKSRRNSFESHSAQHST